MKKSLATALMRGSHEINRQRDEIKSVIGILKSAIALDLGRLPPLKPERVFSKLRTDPTRLVYYWKIERTHCDVYFQGFCVTDEGARVAHRSAQSLITGGSDTEKNIDDVGTVVYSSLMPSTLALDSTIVVHEELEVLVEWALGFFGEEFRHHLSPLFCAAGASWAVKGK